MRRIRPKWLLRIECGGNRLVVDCRHSGFTHGQWQAVARAETDWIAHCERVGQDSYLARDPTPGFRIH